jgi:hypothetical protein
MAPADSLCGVTNCQAHGFRSPFGRHCQQLNPSRA